MIKNISLSYKTLAFTSILLTATIAKAQQPLAAWQPTHQEMMQRYKRVQLLDSITKNTVYKTTVQANWNKAGTGFWYVNILKDSVREYIWVDAIKGEKKPAFNQQALATSLSKLTGKNYDASHLRISQMEIDPTKNELAFTQEGEKYTFNTQSLISEKVIPIRDSVGRRGRGERRINGRWSRWGNFETDLTSPDKKWRAYIENGNVFAKPTAGGEAVRFTTNGTTKNPYGSLAWSPDSKYMVGYLIHPVIDSNVYYVLSSVPGTMRGQLRSHPYKQPGDPFTTYEMHLFTVSDKTDKKVNTDIIDFFAAPQLHWNTDNRYFSYEKVDRGHQRFCIIKVDSQTGDTSNILIEKTKTFMYESRIITYYLPKTKEIIRSSEQDGWQHLFLVNETTKQEKLITKGNWIVRDVDSIDEQKREIWFSASGMNPSEDPYFVHYYRIGFDGKNLVALTPAEGNHKLVFSPDKKYYVDTYSQINIAPITALHRTADGKKIMELEQADISQYVAKGIPLTESFHAKGRDGITDIWGVICRPSNFDSTKKYPVIENIYAGPQDAFVPKSFMAFNEMQSIAELGFIVVQIDGMGTANRSKAFHDVCWKNIADAGFPDRILWIKAMAKKYPYADTSRVGLYGTSAGGQDALCGLLSYPSFYKAGVAACGCHDNRIDKQWWNEQWMGYPVGPEYAAQSNVTNAYKLQGNLLLIVGEADNNVPPESTYRVADALIKAGKSFDFLPIPGSDHTDGGPYGRMKKKDFFVKNLLNVDAPQRNNGELLTSH